MLKMVKNPDINGKKRVLHWVESEDEFMCQT